MRKSIKHKKNMPTSPKRMSALPVFYGILALVLAGGAGWLFWLDQQTDHDSPSAAVTLIAPPEKPGEHSDEASPHPDPHDEAKEEEAHVENEEHHAEQKTSDHAEVKEDSHEAPSHGEGEAVEKSPGEAEHTDVVEAPSTGHEKTAEIEDGHDSEASPEATETKKHEVHESDDEQKPENDHAPSPVEAREATAKHTEPATEHVEATPKPTLAPDATVKQKTKLESKVVASLPETNVPLSAVPDPALTKNSDYGLLPIIGPTGRLPWRIYSRPFDDPLDRPRIAIIMSEMGMSKTATKSAIQNLPGAITLSFNPYARDIQNWIEQARAAGHEVLLQLPMEPFGYPKNDPGPQSLLTSLTDRENLKRLDWMLGRFVGYTGVTNQMGSKFTASEADIRPILDVIKSRGLLFLDSRTSAKSVAGQVATTVGLPVAINNRFLDHKADRATIDSRLNDLERIARYTGTAVGIGYPYPVTLERISKWEKTLARKGLVLVPVSAAINRQEIR